MSDHDALAERLLQQFGTWGECQQPCVEEDRWRSVADALRAFLVEHVTRKKIGYLLRHSPCEHRDQRIGPCYDCAVDAVLALLRREMGGAR